MTISSDDVGSMEYHAPKKSRVVWWIIGAVTAVLVALAVFVATSVTFFVIQPIGALPEGTTIVMKRTGKLQMVESADGICDRTMGGVSLICRMAMLKLATEAKKEGNVYFQLPYNERLYLLSTDGKTWER